MSLFTQPAIYSPIWWGVIVLISFCVARYTRWWCIPIGYLAVAAIIDRVDVAWIHYEMSKPGWDGTPDRDIVFAIGMMVRIGFMSAAMIPVTVVGVWLRRRRTKACRKPPATLPPPRRVSDESVVT